MGGILGKLFNQEDEDESDDLYNRVLNRYELNEQHSGGEIDDDETDEENSVLYEKRTGTITDVTPDYCLIDGKYYCQIDETNCHIIVSGQKVDYTARKASKYSEWRVVDVQNTMPDEENDEQKEEIEIKTTTVGKVIAKNRNIVIIHPDMKCDLRKVIVTYVLAIGDWVSVEISKTKYNNDENVTVHSIKPLRSFEVIGYITHWDSSTNNGIINSEIIFSKSTCVSQYTPEVDDKVIALVIESHQHDWSMRAISVTLILAGKYRRQSDDSHTPENMEELLANKNGIQVSCIQQHGIKNLGEIGTYTIQAENGGTTSVYIKLITNKNLYSGNLVEFENLHFPICIEPTAKINIKVHITPRHLGNFRELITLLFDGDWEIGVLLTVDVDDMEDVSRQLQFRLGNARKHSNDSRKLLSYNTDKYLYVRGVRPKVNQKFIPRRMQPYFIPKFFLNSITEDDAVKYGECLKQALIEHVSVVTETLSYDNYIQKWDICLYLGEIEEKIKVKKLNRERGSFFNKGEYLVLRLSDMPEIDIGLCIGDKLFAHSLCAAEANERIISYEGVIYNIRSNEIYLKFKSSFHSNHGGKDYSIIFQTSRTKYIKAHQAIRDVCNDNDSDVQWLFPTKMVKSKSALFEIIGEVPPETDEPDRQIFCRINSSSRDNYYSERCLECRAEISRINANDDDDRNESVKEEKNDDNEIARNVTDGKNYNDRNEYRSSDRGKYNSGKTVIGKVKLVNSDDMSYNEELHDEDAAAYSSIYKNKIDAMSNDDKTDSTIGLINQRRILKWFNTSLNHYQKNAIRNIMRGEGRPLPYIIFGPPGTGKTITLVELILQLWSNVPQSRLLICAPSNSAVNVICERLLQYNILKPGEIIRLLAYNYALDHSLPESLRNFCAVPSYECEDERIICIKDGINFITPEKIGRHRITLCTCVTAGILCSLRFPDDHFTHVICDEACQPREPDIMIPISLLNMSNNDRNQIILAGDPEQLGPANLLNGLNDAFGFNVPFMTRLLGCNPYLKQSKYASSHGYDPKLVTILIKNYRSVPEVLNLYSSLFYNSVLEPTVCSMHGEYNQFISSLKDYLPKRGDKGPPSVVFHGIEGNSVRDENGSLFNLQEVMQVIFYVSEFYKCHISKDDIGIITPYRAQVKQIIEMIQHFLEETPKVASVEEFQGQEKKLIILSTVRTIQRKFDDRSNDINDNSNSRSNNNKSNLGFVDDPKRINVAVSRARYLLVIVGDPFALAKNTKWRCVIDYCKNNHSYVGCQFE